MNRAFYALAITVDTESKDNKSGIAVDIHICNSEREAIDSCREQAERNNPDQVIKFIHIRELDMEHLMKDWINGNKTGRDYYLNEEETIINEGLDVEMSDIIEA